MAWREKSSALLVILAALATQGCNGFGTNCSTDAECQAQNPEAICDPTLKVCFIYSGPVVTSIQPANQAPTVAPDGAQVVATFSTSIVDAGPSTFLVVGQGFDTFGTYTLNAAMTQATFTPLAAGLALGTDYTVNLTAGIADTSGNPLLPFTSTFSTTDGTFGAGGTLRPPYQTGAYTLGGNYFGAFVTAVDLYIGNGTSNDFALQVGISAPGSNPQITTFLQNTVGQEVDFPSAAIAPDGTALVAWTTEPTDAGVPVTFTALVSAYSPTAHTWSPTVKLSGPDPSSEIPLVVAFNATDGADGLAVWLHDAGASNVVHGRYYSGAAGWGTEGSIQSDDVPNASNVSVSADFAGNVLTVWQSQTGAGLPEIVAGYLGIDGTVPPTVAVSSPAAYSVTPQVSLGISGLGAVVWSVYTSESDGGALVHVFASTFNPQSNPSFSPPVQLDNAPTFANYPQVGVAADGNAFAIWQELGAIVTSTYTQATNSWSAPITLDSLASQLLNGPVVAVDPGGNAVANWLKFTPDGGYQMFGGRYTVDGGWHGQQQITVGVDPVEDILPAMVSDAQGRTMTLETRRTSATSYLEYIPFH
jgi:Bacterial Ig-like domain